MTKSARMHRFVEAIWIWYAVHKRRDLPWRHIEQLDETDRAYRVLVSEIMLQQTQVPRVTILFPRFLEKFPTIERLAGATNRDMIMAWRGLGYNNRAIRLRDAARAVAAGCSFTGSATEQQATSNQQLVTFPRTLEELRSLPGIGPYTAAAIRNFAFNIPTPCVDVNIARIYERVFGPDAADIEKLSAEILAIAIDEKRGRSAREWHSALMDFGSLVCVKRHPKYDDCPLMAEKLYIDPYKETGVTTSKRKEPSRGNTPNRIFRGRIVESLRSSSDGLTALNIGKKICEDWDTEKDRAWLDRLLKALTKDNIIASRKKKYILAE